MSQSVQNANPNLQFALPLPAIVLVQRRLVICGCSLPAAVLPDQFGVHCSKDAVVTSLVSS